MLAALIAIAFQQTALDEILDDDKLSGSLISCMVTDETGAALYEHNSSLRVMPASNQKILTNSFALAKLGPNYRPQTRIWKLPNKVIVDSQGDPMMTHERLQRAAKELGLRQNLPVYVREAYSPMIPPSWEWDDLPNKYAAPITAFTVDRGSIELWAQGERMWITPRNYGLKPVRGARTGKRTVIYNPAKGTLIVTGELPSAATRIDTLALPNPNDSAASYLGRARATTKQLPSTPATLTLGGPPISETIKECLVKSDNNLAENLLLMGAAKNGPLTDKPYTFAPAQMRSFMINAVKVDPNDFRPYDGSGMSRHNLVTTRGIVKLLTWAAKQPTREVWMAALAKPGAGTLSTRLDGVEFVGKTGTLDMVVALSGYVKSKDNKTYIVSLILNHFLCSEREARTIADKFIKKLYDGGAFGTLSANKRVYEARRTYSRTLASTLGWNS